MCHMQSLLFIPISQDYPTVEYGFYKSTSLYDITSSQEWQGNTRKGYLHILHGVHVKLVMSQISKHISLLLLLLCCNRELPKEHIQQLKIYINSQ